MQHSVVACPGSKIQEDWTALQLENHITNEYTHNSLKTTLPLSCLPNSQFSQYTSKSV